MLTLALKAAILSALICGVYAQFVMGDRELATRFLAWLGIFLALLALERGSL